MAINIRPGAVSAGYGFGSFALPALAQVLHGASAGMKEREQTLYERQQVSDEKARRDRAEAANQLRMLIDLHGPDVVKQPEFGDLYTKITGKPWPTIQQVTEEEVEPAKPAVPPGPIGDVAGEMVPSTPGVPAIPPVTRQVTTTVPQPLGGRYVEQTLGKMGLVDPDHPLARVTPSQAKALGIDLGKVMGLEPQTESQVLGNILYKISQGQATPQMLKALAIYKAMKDTPDKINTIEGYIAHRLLEVGGDADKLLPWEKQGLDKIITGRRTESVEQEIMREYAKNGIKGLNDAQKDILYNKILRSPEKIGWSEYKTRLAMGDEQWPTDPRAIAMLQKEMQQPGATNDVELRQLRILSAKAFADMTGLQGKLQMMIANIQVQRRKPTASEQESIDKLATQLADAHNNWKAYQSIIEQYDNRQPAVQPGVYPGGAAPQGPTAPAAQPAPGTQPGQPQPMQWAQSFLNDMVTALKQESRQRGGFMVSAANVQATYRAIRPKLVGQVPQPYLDALDRIIANYK